MIWRGHSTAESSTTTIGPGTAAAARSSASGQVGLVIVVGLGTVAFGRSHCYLAFPQWKHFVLGRHSIAARISVGIITAGFHSDSIIG